MTIFMIRSFKYKPNSFDTPVRVIGTEQMATKVIQIRVIWLLWFSSYVTELYDLIAGGGRGYGAGQREKEGRVSGFLNIFLKYFI